MARCTKSHEVTLTANSACSRWAELTAWRSCRRLIGRLAESRNSLATASLGVTTVAEAVALNGSTAPSADISSTRETFDPRLQGEPESQAS